MRWLRSHQLMLIIYIGGLTLAVLELHLPQLQLDYLTRSESLLEPETNIADVSSALYPDRAHSFYYRALQAAHCSGAGGETPPECRKRAPVTQHEVRELIERSLATGNRSIEMAMYNYAIVLLNENAAPELVDAAIHDWRTNYPQSHETDPREWHREMLEETESGTSVGQDEFEGLAR